MAHEVDGTWYSIDMEIVGLFGLPFMVGVSMLCIVGGYQAYFWPQKSPIKKCLTGTVTELDKRIPFVPESVWVYSFFYYPFMISPVIWIESVGEFIWVCLSFYTLLAVHILISRYHPIQTPPNWRVYEDKNISTKFLKLIQKIDKGGNCFPSMHVGVATLAACHLSVYLQDGPIIWILCVWSVVALISLSSVLTKQHFAVDILWGVIFALVVYFAYITIVPLQWFEISASQFLDV